MIVSKSRLMEVPVNTLVQSETSYIYRSYRVNFLAMNQLHARLISK